MHLRYTSTAVLGLLSAACNGPLSSEADFPEGTFLLSAVDQHSLPIDHGPIPARFGGLSECRIVLDEGRLSLDPEKGRYELHYFRRSSCTGRILSESSQLGSYSQHGSELVFERPSIDRPSQFRGAIRDESIEVQLFDQQMVFSRPSASTTPPISGHLTLRSAGEQPVPVPFGGNAGIDCPLMLDSASLNLRPDSSARTVFAPATGSFSLWYQLRSSCSGEVMHHREEQGSYEEIEQVIYFEARSARGLHRYRGVKQGNGAIKVYFGGLAWPFGK